MHCVLARFKYFGSLCKRWLIQFLCSPNNFRAKLPAVFLFYKLALRLEHFHSNLKCRWNSLRVDSTPFKQFIKSSEFLLNSDWFRKSHSMLNCISAFGLFLMGTCAARNLKFIRALLLFTRMYCTHSNNVQNSTITLNPNDLSNTNQKSYNFRTILGGKLIKFARSSEY